MASSPEAQIFTEMMAHIECCIIYGVLELIPKAIAERLITIQMGANIRSKSEGEQALYFLEIISKKIATNPTFYMEKFIKMLSDEPIYDALVEEISKLQTILITWKLPTHVDWFQQACINIPCHFCWGLQWTEFSYAVFSADTLTISSGGSLLKPHLSS